MFQFCLALIREWSKILLDGADNDFKEACYKDLLPNGTTLYQEVMMNFCQNFFSNEEVYLLSKSEVVSFKELFNVANQEMTALLE